VSLARGEFLAFLDADDRFVAPKLERQLEELQAHPNLDLVYALVREFVSPELPPGAREGMRPPAPAPAAFHCPGAMLVRRPSFDRVGPFSNDLQVGETVDWCLRAVELALETHVVPEVLLERRLHTQNTGLRARASSADYARALKASLDRRRAEAAPGE
jgi:hypothetical protein